MNTLRINALLLAATLAFAPAFGMEEAQTVVVEEQELVMFEGFDGEEIACQGQTTEATVWYKKRSIQVAGAVAAAYAVALCTGKVRSPLALMAAFTSLLKSAKVEDVKVEDVKIEAVKVRTVAEMATDTANYANNAPAKLYNLFTKGCDIVKNMDIVEASKNMDSVILTEQILLQQ